jgi:proton-translocating NADH-quinone oxidoreductase chain L
MYLLILFLPILNFIITILFGRLIGRYYIFIYNIIFSFLVVIISYFAFYEVILLNNECYVNVYNWINISFLNVNCIFLYDSLTCVMLMLVSTISFLVICYSIEYMYDDPHVIRFLSYLSLFTFYMLLLLVSNNFLYLFLAWEGVGLSSYLLINFWFTRIQANKSAMKAIIMNRFGDFGIYFSLILIFLFFKTFDFNVIFLINDLLYKEFLIIFNYKFNIITIICFFLFIGVMGKSSQLGLHTWLPDAMEGPTPVSALIHAATMVTAGIFVILRCCYLFEFSPIMLIFLSIIGCLTSIFSGTVGFLQSDIKKIIAYSTCSQLGFMTLVCGCSGYMISIFHLFNHGFFKASLFLGAGSIIHSLFDEQDIRKMGGLLNILPFTYIIFLIGSLSLAGFLFTTGYYSKDIILEILFSNYNINLRFVYYLSLISVFYTMFYSIRLLFYVFYDNYKGYYIKIIYLTESKFLITFVLTVLVFFSIFIGYIFKDLYVGIGTDMWVNSLFFFYNTFNIFKFEFLFFFIKLLPLIITIIAIIVFYIFYDYYNYKFIVNLYKNNLYQKFFYFFIKKWYIDLLYNWYIVNYFFKFSYQITFKLIDRGYLEYIGPLNIVRILNKLTYNINLIYTGFIYQNIFIIIIFSIISIFLFIFNIYNIFILFFIFFSILIFNLLN